jgi:competence protein ComEC
VNDSGARRWSPWQIFCCCIAAILLADPLAMISESLWLSVFAVAALIFWYQNEVRLIP